MNITQRAKDWLAAAVENSFVFWHADHDSLDLSEYNGKFLKAVGYSDSDRFALFIFTPFDAEERAACSREGYNAKTHEIEAIRECDISRIEIDADGYWTLHVTSEAEEMDGGVREVVGIVQTVVTTECNIAQASRDMILRP